jgi:hypothetical protein
LAILNAGNEKNWKTSSEDHNLQAKESRKQIQNFTTIHQKMSNNREVYSGEVHDGDVGFATLLPSNLKMQCRINGLPPPSLSEVEAEHRTQARGVWSTGETSRAGAGHDQLESQ